MLLKKSPVQLEVNIKEKPGGGGGVEEQLVTDRLSTSLCISGLILAHASCFCSTASALTVQKEHPKENEYFRVKWWVIAAPIT